MDLIAWDQICKPKMDGDLRIRSVRSKNKALLAKQGWRVYHDDKEWSTIQKHKYLFNAPYLSNFLSYPNVFSPSSIWGVVQGEKNILINGCSWKVGNGQKIRFCDDAWILDHPLIEDFQDRTQIDRCKQMFGTLVEHYWINNKWINLVESNQAFHNTQLILNAFILYPHIEDKIIWGADASGCFKVSSMFRTKEKGPHTLWNKAWIKGLTPKINIFFWIFLQNKILTLDNLRKRGINVVNRCSLCKEGYEDRNHLFLSCTYSQKVWSFILNYWNLDWVQHNNLDQCFQSQICPSKESNTSFFVENYPAPYLVGNLERKNNKFLIAFLAITQ